MRCGSRRWSGHTAVSLPAVVLELALAVAFALGSPSARAQGWPAVKLPSAARAEVVAGDMVLNGMSCRMLRFEVRGSGIAEVQAFYRGEFGPKRVVENRVEGDPVIATRQGDYFITVRLHNVPGNEAKIAGTVMTTLTAGKPSSSAVLVDTRQMFPADTEIVSSVQTNDSGKRSLIVVGVNRNSVSANRDHVIDALAQRGFRPTRQPPGRQPGDAAGGPLPIEMTSPSEDASVTVSEAGPVRSVVIHRLLGAK